MVTDILMTMAKQNYQQTIGELVNRFAVVKLSVAVAVILATV